MFKQVFICVVVLVGLLGLFFLPTHRPVMRVQPIVSVDPRPTVNSNKNVALTTAPPKKKQIKVIFHPIPERRYKTRYECYSRRFEADMKFEGCEYSNCVMRWSQNRTEMLHADIILCEIQAAFVQESKDIYKKQNKDQLRIVWNDEPPHVLGWRSRINEFHATMTYTRESLIFWPFGETLPFAAESNRHIKPVNYAENKTKGAFAYITHCGSSGYHRTQTMEKLSKYIQVDIYGKCTGTKPPCPRMDYKCEDNIHIKSRFFLAFENSLCRDYLTEKFWRRLQSSGYYVPVVMGGLSIENYNRVAPPDSFIHALNFTSIDQLGKYLKHLMEDDEAYNRYHQWRDNYRVSTSMPKRSVCKLCMLANNPHTLLSQQPKLLTQQWRKQSTCRRVPNSWFSV